MKNVLLSADGDVFIYSVPDKVADNLKHYCLKFQKWWTTNPEAKKYYVKKYGEFCTYFPDDFVEYMHWAFPNEPFVLVGIIDSSISYGEWPKEYKKMTWFNF